MARCHKCGGELETGDLFCGTCGAPVQAEAKPKPQPLTCPKCHKPILPDELFCGECGQKLESQGAEKFAASSNIQAAQSTEAALPATSPVAGAPPPVKKPVQSAPKKTVVSKPPPPRAKRVPSTITQREPSFSYKSANKKGGHKAIWITLAIAGVLLSASAVFLAYLFFAGESFSARVDKALAQNQIFSPPGECVADIMAAERAKNRQNPKLVEASRKIKAKIWPVVNNAFQSWYKDSKTETSWDEIEKNCSLLATLYPQDREIAARLAYARAQQAIAQKLFERAQKYYRKALSEKPGWVLALNGLGKVYGRDNSIPNNDLRAVAYYQRAIQADPAFTWAYVNLAAYYAKQKELDQAKEYMLKGLATYPSKVSLIIRTANLFSEMSDYRSALTYYKKALSLESDPRVKKSLVDAITRTMKLLPANNSVGDNMANVASRPYGSPGELLRPLSGNDMPDGCSCSFVPAAVSENDYLNSVVAAWQDTDSASLQVVVAGRKLALPLISSKESPIIPGKASIGDAHSRIYFDGRVRVDIEYRTTWLCPVNDESCEVTKYRGFMIISASGQTEKITVRGECGC